MNAQLIIAAAGMGRRLGFDTPKALTALHGRSLISVTLSNLASLPVNKPVIIIVPPSYEKDFSSVLDEFSQDLFLVPGGQERQESVYKSLQFLSDETELVIIHDAARPFISAQLIGSAMAAAQDCGAATLAVPSSDTIMISNRETWLAETPDRRTVWACQTPQVFQTAIIRYAHETAMKEGKTYTDDATLVHAMGYPVRLVKGSSMNFKITTQQDLRYASYLIERGLVECA